MASSERKAEKVPAKIQLKQEAVISPSTQQQDGETSKNATSRPEQEKVVLLGSYRLDSIEVNTPSMCIMQDK